MPSLTLKAISANAPVGSIAPPGTKVRQLTPADVAHAPKLSDAELHQLRANITALRGRAAGDPRARSA